MIKQNHLKTNVRTILATLFNDKDRDMAWKIAKADLELLNRETAEEYALWYKDSYDFYTSFGIKEAPTYEEWLIDIKDK